MLLGGRGSWLRACGPTPIPWDPEVPRPRRLGCCGSWWRACATLPRPRPHGVDGVGDGVGWREFRRVGTVRLQMEDEMMSEDYAEDVGGEAERQTTKFATSFRTLALVAF